MKEYVFKYRDFAEALYDALLPDPFYRTMENSIPGDTMIRKEKMLRYFDYSMIECDIYGRLYIPNQQRYGVSVWSKSVDQETELEKKDEKSKDARLDDTLKKDVNDEFQGSDLEKKDETSKKDVNDEKQSDSNKP